MLFFFFFFLPKLVKISSCPITKNVYMYHHYRNFNQLMTSTFIIIMLNKIDINKYYKSPHFSSFLGLKKNHSIKERGTIPDLSAMYICDNHVRTVKNFMSIYGSSRFYQIEKRWGREKTEFIIIHNGKTKMEALTYFKVQ